MFSARLFLRRMASRARGFARDRQGNVALLTGLLAVPLVGAVGFGIDYTRAVNYRIKLDAAANAASLAAIDTARALMAANPNLTEADVRAASIAKAQQVFTSLAPVESTPIVSSNFLLDRVGRTFSASGSYSAYMPTTFTAVLGVARLDIVGAIKSDGAMAPPLPNDPNILVKEEALSATGLVSGRSYIVLNEFNGWKSAGGLEISLARNYTTDPTPFASPFAIELDSFQNASASQKVYLNAGPYEVRYFFNERIAYSDYSPGWLCGSRPSDVDWANAQEGNWGAQTNRIAFYFDPAFNDTPPANLTPATHNMIDACVVSGGNWIERSIKVTVNTPGYFWLTIQAEGASDRFGGVVSDIRLCKVACPGAPLESFPWPAGSVLFKDDFSTPSGSGAWTERTLDESGDNLGWARLPIGWTTWPINQVDFATYMLNGVTTPRLGLDATYLRNSAGVTTESTSNRSISRRFFLAPGYYSVRYVYLSVQTPSVFSGVLCGLANHASNLATAGTNSFAGRVFMDADLRFSHPEVRPVVRSLAYWRNPDGSGGSLPRLPSTAIDACAYSATPTQRNVAVKIVKPGFYWLTFSGEGAADEVGASISKVSLVALGGLSMAAPPASPTTIPAPGLAPGTAIILNGVQISSN